MKGIALLLILLQFLCITFVSSESVPYEGFLKAFPHADVSSMNFNFINFFVNKYYMNLY